MYLVKLAFRYEVEIKAFLEANEDKLKSYEKKLFLFMTHFTQQKGTDETMNHNPEPGKSVSDLGAWGQGPKHRATLGWFGSQELKKAEALETEAWCDLEELGPEQRCTTLPLGFQAPARAHTALDELGDRS